jgi:hypothetical protein
VFVVEIDDPDAAGTDFRCVDGDLCDLADGELGFIRFAFEQGTTAVAGTATSKPALGNATVPALILDVTVDSTEDSLNIRVTDSDFTVPATTGLATSLRVLFETEGTLSIDYLADPANGEFTGSNITNITEILPALSRNDSNSGAAPALAPGSVSIVASLLDTGGASNLEGFFAATLSLDDGISPPPFQVPDVVGLSEAEAEAELEAEGFIVGETFFVENCIVTPRTVLGQDPDAGTPLPAGSQVDLTVSTASDCVSITDSTSVPTLSEWGMILMIALLVLLGGRRFWRS